jgi:hypothetical protein
MKMDQSHEASHQLSQPPSAPTDTEMDDLRESFSGMKKDIKHRLTGSKRKADRTWADGRGERADSSGSLQQPSPDVVTGGGRGREGSGSNTDGGVQPSAVADEKKSDWKSTASASAKLLLRGVRDSADAFPPLKSVAGGLFFILENCEVRSPDPYAIHHAYSCPSKRRQISKQ